VLEALQAARPESLDAVVGPGPVEALPGGANEAATTEVTYDIDVATYGSHSRVQYYLDFFQGPARERFSIWLQRMPRYESMIREKLRENGVPEDMVYLALIESGFSNAAVSRARAAGMWQFMKGTAKLYGLRVDTWVDERRDPIRATDAAARHLADLRDHFGSMYLAAAAYNAGAGRVSRGLRRLGGEDEEDEENPDAQFFRLYDTRLLRRETKDYVPKLIAAALIAKQPAKYGFEKSEVEPLTYDSVLVPDATGLDVLARLADTTVEALRDLNPQFIHRVTPPRQTAVVRVPAGRGPLVTARYEALPAKSRVSFVEHTVGRGQTFGTIAAMYRVSTRVIQDANPGVRSGRLRVGTRLVIPTSFVPTVAEPIRRSRPAPPTGSETTIRYRVRSGESLWSISQRYGTTIARLRALNALGREEELRIGQVIRVPAPVREEHPMPTTGGRSHTVRRGETLSGIASRYQVSLSALRAANGLDMDTMLRAGTRLTIPE
jgi:membrane-bound lytic murein transglycosylase D